MELVFRCRFLHFVVAVRDFSKDEDDLEAVSNTGGSFEPTMTEMAEDENGSACEPLDYRFGFRVTREHDG